MNYFFLLVAIHLLQSCTQIQQSIKGKTNIVESKIGKFTKIEVDSIQYITSIYDDQKLDERLMEHKKKLKELSDKKLFSLISTTIRKKLPEKHKAYFESREDYEILSNTNGNIFLEANEDGAFVVYDKKEQRISIILYHGKTGKYAKLFKEIKVENGLENAECNYAAFGTLDYQIGEVIISQEAMLSGNPESYFEFPNCKIGNFHTDKDLAIESGCFSNKISKNKISTVLLIPTSSVYNNWECLVYNKTSNSFLIFYGQAFAD
jgi:hypothetical protein